MEPYSVAQFEITWILETYVPALLQMELPDSTWNGTGVGHITKRYVPLGVHPSLEWTTGEPLSGLGGGTFPSVCLLSLAPIPRTEDARIS
jgi:hypothetical protein